MKKVLLILVATVFSFSAAIADVMVTAGVSANTSGFAAEGKERNYGYAGALTKTTIEYGAFKDSYSSIFAEVGNGTVGFGISYVPTSIATPENVNTQVHSQSSTTDEKVQVNFDDLTTLYAIARLPKWGMYVKAGIAQVDLAITEDHGSANYSNTDTDGYTIGFGFEKDAGDTGLALRLEFMAHEFDDVSTNNGSAAGAADANVIDVSDMIGATATISIVKNF